MAKTLVSIENLTNPGQPLAHLDRYRRVFSDGTFKDSRYAVTTKPLPTPAIRVIATKAFYRRMTQAERSTLRGTADDNINDLREDLQRSPTVDLNDPELLTMLQATPLSQVRIDELLADGTEAERYVNVVTGQ